MKLTEQQLKFINDYSDKRFPYKDQTQEKENFKKEYKWFLESFLNNQKFAESSRNEETIIHNCTCDKSQCVKSRNIGKFCKYRQHIVDGEYLRG